MVVNDRAFGVQKCGWMELGCAISIFRERPGKMNCAFRGGGLTGKEFTSHNVPGLVVVEWPSCPSSRPWPFGCVHGCSVLCKTSKPRNQGGWKSPPAHPAGRAAAPARIEAKCPRHEFPNTHAHYAHSIQHPAWVAVTFHTGGVSPPCYGDTGAKVCSSAAPFALSHGLFDSAAAHSATESVAEQNPFV